MYRYTILLILLSASGTLSAQSYFFTQHNGNPKNAAIQQILNNQADDASDLNNGGWNKIMSTSANPAYSGAQQIPFTFLFAGNTETAFKISNTGFLTFDTNTTGTPPENAQTLPASSLPSKTVAAWGINCKGDNDVILTGVFGSAPNRQLWIKFASISTVGDTTETYSYFSIVLEETSNKIYVVLMHQGQGNDQPVIPEITTGVQVNSSTAIDIENTVGFLSPFPTTKLNNDNIYYEFEYGAQANFDLAVSPLYPINAVKAGSNTDVQYVLRNYGSENIDSSTVYYNINNGSIISQKIYPGLGPNGIYSTGYVISNLNIAGPAGTLYNIKIWVEEANGQQEVNRKNDTVNYIIVATNGVVQAPKVLVESATATWCNTCPLVNLKLDDIKKRFGDTVIIAQHHILDEMQGNSVNFIDNNFREIPLVASNRIHWDVAGISQNIDSLEKQISTIINFRNTTPVNVEVSNLSFNESTGLFSYEVKGIFADYYYGDLNIGGLVVEDNVRGVGVGFSQRIAGSLTDDVTDWYYQFANPILGYYHQKVVWNMNGGDNGNFIGAKLYSPGDSIVETFTYTFAEVLKMVNLGSSPYLPVGDIYSLGKPADISAVGYVYGSQNGLPEIINSNISPLWNLSANRREVSTREILVYPNPVEDKLFVSAISGNYNVRISNSRGQEVYQSSQRSEGTVMELDVSSIANSGIYFLEISNAMGIVSRQTLVFVD